MTRGSLTWTPKYGSCRPGISTARVVPSLAGALIGVICGCATCSIGTADLNGASDFKFSLKSKPSTFSLP